MYYKRDEKMICRTISIPERSLLLYMLINLEMY